jgi:CTP:molybdopterin cytidylyltransferase MocA
VTEAPRLTSPLLILAGGASRRMGRSKALLRIEDKPWVLHQAESWFQAGGDRLLIVCSEEVEEAIRPVIENDARITLLPQTTPRAPMSSSLSLGLNSLEDPSSLFLLPVDVPAPPPEDWRKMEACISEEIDAVLPYRGGHPVLLCRPLLSRLEVEHQQDFRLDKALEQSRKQQAVAFCHGEFPFARTNMNTPADWQDWLAKQNLDL